MSSLEEESAERQHVLLKKHQQTIGSSSMPKEEEELGSTNDALQKKQTVVGVHGVQLKEFEKVLAHILKQGVRPSYVQLPPWSSNEEEEKVLQLLQTLSEILSPSPSLSVGTERKKKKKKPKNVSSAERASRKQLQLGSLLQCMLAMLPPPQQQHINSPQGRRRRLKVVDFCGGTGHLALPLALLRPDCDVVVVDLKKASLDLVHTKAHQVITSNEFAEKVVVVDCSTGSAAEHEPLSDSSTTQTIMMEQSTELGNLFTFHGSVTDYQSCDNDSSINSFDLGVALHACGEATDVVLRQCAKAQAAFVTSPCCVGKLNRARADPYIYHATATNHPTISYPQSQWLSSLLAQNDAQNVNHVNDDFAAAQNSFDALAKAADYSDLQDMRTCRNASRRVAKAILETDRLHYMQEQAANNANTNANNNAYQVALTRMVPWEASPKNDILLGWMDPPSTNANEDEACKQYQYVGSPFQRVQDNVVDNDGTSLFCLPCEDCNADVEMAVRQLVGDNENKRKIQQVVATNEETTMMESTTKVTETMMETEPQTTSATGADKCWTGDSVDWTRAEEEEVHKELQQLFFASANNGKYSSTVLATGENTVLVAPSVQIYRYPKGIGSRRRKLVHHVAAYLGLAHWSEGRKHADRIVAVAHKGTRRRNEEHDNIVGQT